MKRLTIASLFIAAAASCSPLPNPGSPSEDQKARVKLQGVEYTEDNLKPWLGLPMDEVIRRLNLAQAKRHFWVNEPAFYLRGRRFCGFPDNAQLEVLLFLDDQ